MKSHESLADAPRVLLIRTKPTRGYVTAGPDLGLAYLKTAFSREISGSHIRVLDFLKLPGKNPGLIETLREFRPTLVGFKANSQDIPEVNRIAAIVASERPDATIVVGGSFPSGIRRDFFNNVSPAVEYGFVGEADLAVDKLLSLAVTGEGHSNVPGLIYTNDGVLQINSQSFPGDLDALGIPDRSDMNPADYPIDYEGNTYVPVMTTRGCPYRCTFCSTGLINGHRLRYRSALSMVEEVTRLKADFGLSNFCLVDDNFTFNKDHALTICAELAAKTPWIKWRCSNGVQPDTLDEEILRAMERAGCYEVYVGIQTGSESVGGLMNRDISPARIVEKVRLIRRVTRFRLLGFFIVGHPAEESSDIRKTIRLALRLPLDMASFFYLVPHPGTPIYNELVKTSGTRWDWNDFRCDNLVDVPRRLPGWQIKFWQKCAYIAFYFRPWIIFRLLQRVSSWRQFSRLVQRAFAVAVDR